MVCDGRQSPGERTAGRFIQYRRRVPGTLPARAARRHRRFPTVHCGSADEPSGGLRTPFTLPSNAAASLSVQRATLTTGRVARGGRARMKKWLIGAGIAVVAIGLVLGGAGFAASRTSGTAARGAAA